MNWRSPFADGSCTVVVRGNNVEVFRSTFAAGGSQGFSDPAQPELLFTLEVSGDGVVSLSGPQYGGGGGVWEIHVIPQMTPTTAMQVSGFAADVSIVETDQMLVFGSSDTNDDFTTLTVRKGHPSTGAPDPCPIPDPKPGVKPTLWGVFAQMTGA